MGEDEMVVLQEAVAEKVLGWKSKPGEYGRMLWRASEYDVWGRIGDGDGMEGWQGVGLIVEAMRAKGYEDQHYQGSAGNVVWIFRKHGQTPFIEAYTEDFVACAKAALLAVG